MVFLCVDKNSLFVYLLVAELTYHLKGLEHDRWRIHEIKFPVL